MQIAAQDYRAALLLMVCVAVLAPLFYIYWYHYRS